MARERITFTRTSGTTPIEGVTSSGVADTNDYDDLMRRARVADAKSPRRDYNDWEAK